MANYDFSTITAAQALAYNGATDMLSTPIGDSITDFLVGYDDAAGTVRLVDTDSGHAVVFGSGIYGELVFGAGGQAMHIGSPGPDLETFATVNFGGAGNDTIEGCNVAYGGPGADLFDTDKANHIDQIADWESGDSLYMSFLTPTAANYVEGTAADQNAATAFANQQIAAGKAYVVVAVGPNLFAYADDSDTRAFAGFPGTVSTTEIMGRGLNDISASNFVTSAPNAVVVVLPPPGSAGADGFIFGDMENIHLSSLIGAPITGANATQLTIGSHDGVELVLTGFGFTYDANQQLTGGSVNSIFFQQPMPDGSFFQSSLNVNSIAAAPFANWVATDATQTALSTILSGNDQISGNDLGPPDVIHGYGGNDLLYGGGGADTIWGGDGDDTIYAQTPPNILGGGAAGSTYLRGEAGNDTIVGGPVFDDINGNMGNDSIDGGSGGSDWLVGGQGDDLIRAHASDNILYGNLGNDTLIGGSGNDVIRGGQGDDSIAGGAGNNFISGDRGNDTESGGAGADLFHGSQDAGIDRVLDFHVSEGDRVMLDPGTTYTLIQQGADTVLDMGNGNQMILVGVSMSSLTASSIFFG